MTDKEQIMDKLYGALAGLFLVYGISTEEGSGKIIIELLKEAEKQLARKISECEELKEKLDFRTKKLTEDLSCSNECLRKRMVQCSRYRKALEEIEEYQKRNCEVCSFAETKKCDIRCQVFVILGIISKANPTKNKRGERCLKNK